MIEAALKKLLVDAHYTSPMTALHVYPVTFPFDTQPAYPAVLYERTESSQLVTQDGPSGMWDAIYRLFLFETTYLLLMDLVAEIMMTLDGYVGDCEGMKIDYIFVTNQADVYEDIPNVYCSVLDIKIAYQD